MKRSWINSPYSYSLGMFAMMVPSQAFSTFYSYYYVEKLGLGIGLATLARTLFLIWDAVNNPLFGYWSDSTKSRYGRRRPWIFGAIPLFMIALVLVFSPPSAMSQQGLFTWFLLSLLAFEAVATVLWVNYGALFPELYRGNRIRAKASAIQQSYQMAALLLASVLAPLLVSWYSFTWMAIIFALLFGLCMLLSTLAVREQEHQHEGESLKLGEAFRVTLKNKKFWIFNLSNSFAQTVNGLISSIIPFYAKYVLHLSEEAVSILLASVFVSVIPLVFVWYPIVRRLQGVIAWRLSLAVYGLSVVPLWFGHDLISGIIAGICVGFGLAGFLVTPPVLNGSIIDEDARLTGQRREGIYTAVGGFITRSSGLISALAFFVVGMLLGYVSGDEPGPYPEWTFRILMSVVPFCLLLISFLLSYADRFHFQKPDGGERLP